MRIDIEAERRASAVWGNVARDLRVLIEDAGISIAAVARQAGLPAPTVGRVLSGARQPSLEMAIRIGLALNADLSVRLLPGLGIGIRDRFQARMVDLVIREAHEVWGRHPELKVASPARGSVDLALDHRREPLLVATEFQSEIRRLEATVRRCAEKADALAATELARAATQRHGRPPRIGRLLVLRSTSATRLLFREFGATLRAAWPADPSAVYASLIHGAPWPGDGVLWMTIHGADARILPGWPRGTEGC